MSETQKKIFAVILIIISIIFALNAVKVINYFFPQFSLHGRNKMNEKNQFNIDILKAKKYVEENDPGRALIEYQLALKDAKSEEEKRIAIFGIARMQLWLEHYNQAEILYRILLSEKLNKEDYESALGGLVRSLNAQGMSNEALSFVPKNFNFTTPDAVLSVAQSYTAQGKYNEADTLLQKYNVLMKDLPNNSWTQKQYNQLQEKIALNKMTATKEVSEAHIQSSEFERSITEANRFANLNEPDKALIAYQSALKAAPDKPSFRAAQFGIAKMQLWLGNYSLAEIYYRTLLQKELNPEDEDIALEGLILSLNAENRPQEAIDAIPENYVYKNPSTVIYAASAYFSTGRTEQAVALLKEYQELLNSVPENSKISKEYSNLVHKINGPEVPNVLFDKLIKEADTALEQNNPTAALNLFKDALKNADNNASRIRVSRFGIAKSALWLEDYNEAEMEYKNLLSENLSYQDHEIALAGLIRSLNAQNKSKESLQLLFPKNPEMILAAAETYVAEGHMDEAAELINSQSSIINHTKNSNLTLRLSYLKRKIAMAAKTRVKYSNPLFDKYIAQAKCAIDNDNFENALEYYLNACDEVRKCTEKQVVLFGLGNTYFQLNNYSKSAKIYEELLNMELNRDDFDIALNGYVRSKSSMDKTMEAYYSIPEGYQYENATTVVGAAQTALWSGWPYKAMHIINCNPCLITKIPPESNLKRQYNDILWQASAETACDEIGYMHYYEADTEHFHIFRDQFHYAHRFTDLDKTKLFMTRNHYTLPGFGPVNGDIVELGQEGWVNDYLFYNASISGTHYNQWNPTLWNGKLSFKPNDYLIINALNNRTVVESVPALYQHIALTQSEVNAQLEPVYRLYISGSLFSGTFSDHNVRQGYTGTLTGLLWPEEGIYLDYFTRGYRCSFTSPFYFSPLRYKEYLLSARVYRRIGDTWRYYFSMGGGKQTINENPPQSTLKWQCGLRGPFLHYFILDTFLGYNSNAGITSSAFPGPGYARRYFGVNVQVPFD